MREVLGLLNRGPIFRTLHALARRKEERRIEAWRREIGRRAAIDPSVVIAGCLEAMERARIGEGTEIQRHCRITFGDPTVPHRPLLDIGRRVFVGQGTILSIMDSMSIGDHTLIGANCYLLTNQHRYQSREIPIRDQGYDTAPLEIGEDVWIGANSVVMPGIVIGRGAIIGACSVVNKNVGEWEIWAGVPARKIKDRR